jgi:predicted nucleic acid-binding protein
MLLDSNILIYRAVGTYPELDEILSRKELAVASVTKIEALGYPGIGDFEREWLEIAFLHLRVLPLDEWVIARSIALRRQVKIRLGDAIIAGTALVHGLPLVSRNERDFRNIPGLKVINPFRSSEE